MNSIDLSIDRPTNKMDKEYAEYLAEVHRMDQEQCKSRDTHPQKNAFEDYANYVAEAERETESRQGDQADQAE